MANDDTVNPQITDAVTQTNVKVLGEAPAEALAVATQAMAHATGLAMENASQTQGGMQQVNNTSTAAIITLIMQVGTP
jgi:killing trait domain-containing protein